MSFEAFGHELTLSLLPAIGLIILFQILFQVAFLRMPLAEFVSILLDLVSAVFGFERARSQLPLGIDSPDTGYTLCHLNPTCAPA